VAGFVAWLEREGYAVSTINQALSTVKVYAREAAKGGAVEPSDLVLIRAVTGYGGKAGDRLNADRQNAGTATRRSTRRSFERDGKVRDGWLTNKKADHTVISDAQATALRRQPKTPQGRRDAVLIAFLLDFGMREGEAAIVDVTGVNFGANTLTWYRPKVDKWTTQIMPPNTRKALDAYAGAGELPAMGAVLRPSARGRGLAGRAMSTSAIRQRVAWLGRRVGVDTLAPHDLRHHWGLWCGRQVNKNKMSLFTFQEMGGWNSLAMPRLYVGWSAIANDGVQYPAAVGDD
jgi:integrase